MRAVKRNIVTMTSWAPDIRQRVLTLGVPDLDISATDLRARLGTGRPVRYQMPEEVRAYVLRHGLYGTPGEP